MEHLEVLSPSDRMNPTSGTTYTYDGDGRRVKKSDGTLYLVDDSFRPLSIGTTSGSMTKDFVFLGGKRIAFVSLASCNAYYYLSDHLGSTAVIGSGDGKTIQWEADYFPFCSERQVFTALVNNSYQFTGYEYDSDTQYNYAVARFDAGRWGRFLSPDPYLGSVDVSNPQSLNRYAYVLNNPLNLIDPLGLACVVTDNADGTESYLDDDNIGQTCAQAFGDDGGGVTVTADWSDLPGGSGGRSRSYSTWRGSLPPGFDPRKGLKVTNCRTKVISSLALHVGLDALGAIPGEGAVAAAFYGGKTAFQAAQFGTGLATTVFGLADTSNAGAAATGLGTAGIALSIASKYGDLFKGATSFIPIAGQVVAGLSVVLDGYNAFQDYKACVGGHE
jgi:RHS repeat-associated protein